MTSRTDSHRQFVLALLSAFVLAAALSGCAKPQPTVPDSIQPSGETTPPAQETTPAAETTSLERPTGVDVPILSSEHIEPGTQPEPYNSDPPTSGQHYPEPSEPGFYSEAPPDENLVHSMEHGYVILWHDDEGLTPAQGEDLERELRKLVQEEGVSILTQTPKLIVVPREDMKTRFALTAWGRLDRFDDFDRTRILNFIEDFMDEAPESNEE